MEMKKRLRDEYVGLGGTPNKVSWMVDDGSDGFSTAGRAVGLGLILFAIL